MLDFGDTIVAVSSAAGRAARGIVRLSGPNALELAARVFVPVRADQWRGFRRLSGKIRLAAYDRPSNAAAAAPPVAVPAELYIFRAPDSYSGQDCIEIHTIGSPVVLNMLVSILASLGARRAEPGEFTARAFLSGRIDLTRAEAVARIISARSEAELRAARRLMEGELAARIAATCERLADLLALVEADIDFAEEPIEFIRPADLQTQIGDLGAALERLLSESLDSERACALPRVLLLGRPNAGKSSLLNALSGLDRAICSAVAGTTRDILSAPVRIGRGEIILLDAAGVDESTDEILELARARVRALAESVDLICIVVDAAAPSASNHAHMQADVRALLADAFVVESGAAVRGPAFVVVANKADLLHAQESALRAGGLTELALGPVCSVSARTGTGLEDLKRVLAARLHDEERLASPDALQLNSRQRDALRAAQACLVCAGDQCAAIARTAERADLIAFELREALDGLGAITGGVTTEDLLTRIFSSFCIGK